MRTHFSKAKYETSDIMKQASKETFVTDKPDFERMKNIAKDYVFLDLWLPKVLFKVIVLCSHFQESSYSIFYDEV